MQRTWVIVAYAALWWSVEKGGQDGDSLRMEPGMGAENNVQFAELGPIFRDSGKGLSHLSERLSC